MVRAIRTYLPRSSSGMPFESINNFSGAGALSTLDCAVCCPNAPNGRASVAKRTATPRNTINFIAPILNPQPRPVNPAVAPRTVKSILHPPLGATPPQSGMVDFGGAGTGEKFWVGTFAGLGAGYFSEMTGSRNFSRRSSPTGASFPFHNL